MFPLKPVADSKTDERPVDIPKLHSPGRHWDWDASLPGAIRAQGQQKMCACMRMLVPVLGTVMGAPTTEGVTTFHIPYPHRRSVSTSFWHVRR